MGCLNGNKILGCSEYDFFFCQNERRFFLVNKYTVMKELRIIVRHLHRFCHWSPVKRSSSDTFDNFFLA